MVARAHQTLIWERTRHMLRLRSALREFFPAAQAAYADLGLTAALKRARRHSVAARAEPGLIGYYAGASPDGTIAHVSIWDSEEHANQMGRLKEMIIDARADAEKAGVSFTTPIVNYPVDWVV